MASEQDRHSELVAIGDPRHQQLGIQNDGVPLRNREGHRRA
jgi:hypothetical protein